MRKLTDAELAAAEDWMKTRTYRRRVEKLRKRSAAGELMTVEGMAHELGIPVQLVAAMAVKHWNKPGGFIPAINDTGGRAN